MYPAALPGRIVILGQALGPYQIIKRLGSGGMGEVFLAEDPRLGRRVAIKRTTDSSLGPAEARERLRREAQTAAQLNHPNVGAIYDVLEPAEDGPLYIVMEYVEGETLAALVNRGPLTPEHALAIGRQIAEALVDAHGHGVMHRDLKPANVMITPSGRVKVLDFGLARDRVADVNATGTTSVAGPVYGTPGYMAPEQLVGRRGDARSDVYSFGALLFELVTGRAPFRGADQLARIIDGASDRPPEPRALNPNVPQALNDVIVKALAFRPEARFQTAEALRAALQQVSQRISEAPTSLVSDRGVRPAARRALRMPVVVALTLAAAAAAAAGMYWRGGNTSDGARPVIAILPFDVPEGESDLRPLSAGLVELIANGLASTNAITVPPGSLAYPNRKPGDDAQRVAKALGASHVIGGALKRTAAGMELTIRIDQVNEGQEWERSYPGTLEEVLTLATRILGDVVAEVGAASGAAKPAVSSVVAFQQYSQARGFLERRDIPGNIERAIQLLEAAIKTDPNFALAHAALGEAYWAMYGRTKDRQWVDRAEREITFALSSDANQPLVRYSLATVLYGTGQRDRAEQELQKIIQANPIDQAHKQLGIIYIERGEAERGLNELQRAIDLRPGYSGHYVTKAIALLKLTRPDEAEPLLQRAIELQPDNNDAYTYLGTLALIRGQRDRAIEFFEQSIKASPSPQAWSNLGTTLTEAGRRDEALDAFKQAAALQPGNALVQRNLGDMLMRAGRTAEARQAYTAGLRAAQQALDVNPNAPEAHGAMAICLAKLGQVAEALKHVDHAIALAPKAHEPYYRRASILAIANRNSDALAALREALLRGASPGIAARDDDFKPLRELKEFQELVKTR